jgi:ABC-2 type transport system permease protein
MLQKLRTVAVLTKLSTRRFFRDKTALFFGIMFPLIFLLIFGSISSGDSSPTFNVAVLNQSKTAFAKEYARNLKASKVYKVDATATTLALAKDKMSKSQVDGIIILPPSFGEIDKAKQYPTGSIQLLYSQSSSGTGQTLSSILSGSLEPINNKLLGAKPPLAVVSKTVNDHQLSSFDYTFAGLLGFSIIGMGIFGPINVFPELKKQGILRRLHTTPLKVWQYFMATMFSQALTGLVSIAIQFVVAISLFHLKVDGNYLEIVLFIVLSIFMILGIGLAVGGWAKNERQAAPLGNIIAFPMIFLSGTFFPRFAMPEWLQNVSTYLPLTPVIDGLRLLTTEGKHLADLGPQLGLIGLWLVLIYAVAFRVFRWE